MEKILYEVNGGTLYIKGITKDKCIIREINGKEVEYPLSSRKIMNQSCICFGSTLDGRLEGIGELTGIKYKAPVLVSEYQRIIMFPTLSHKENECAWISLLHVVDVIPNDKGVTIMFTDGSIGEFNVSKYILQNQMAKAKSVYFELFNKEKKDI